MTIKREQWTYYPDHYMIRTDGQCLNARANIASTLVGSLCEHELGEHIVMCCNNHYPLVDALQNFIKECQKSVEYSDWPELQEIVEAAEKVIEDSTQ